MLHRRGVLAGAGLLAILVIAAVVVWVTRSSGPFPACARSTAEQLSGTPHHVALPAAADPLSGQMCFYEVNDTPAQYGPARIARLVGSTVLNRRDARTLAYLLDHDGASGSDCTDPVIMRLRYPGRTTTLEASGCDPERLSGPFGLTTTHSLALAALSSESLGATRTPSVIGLTLKAAYEKLIPYLRRHHQLRQVMELTGDAGQVPDPLSATEALDPQVPSGTIIWQTPPAGVGSEGAGADVLVAVHSTPACTSAQLTGLYLGSTFGTGDVFDNMLLADRSATPCSLTGSVRIAGVNARGRRVTQTATATVHGTFVLSARTAPDRYALSAREGMIVAVSVEGEDISGPTGQGCASAPTPARWSVTVGPARIYFINGRPGATGPYAREPFASCDGGLGIADQFGPPQLTN